jgi:hypothetical protein
VSLVSQGPNGLDKLLYALKRLIDTRKPNIRYRIDLTELIHQQAPNDLGLHFAVSQCGQPSLNTVYEFVQAVWRHRAFSARKNKTIHYF